jgi:protein required for attachment to host cells
MPIPNQALILVADGRKTLFLRNHGDAAQLDLRTESHDERADAKDREMKSDAPGLTGQSFGFGRPAMDETDYHQQAEDRWAKDTADILNRRALDGDYQALVIVAPPRTLGELRKQLHKEVEKRLVATFNKEMTDRPIDQIQDLLVGEAAPPA